MNTEEIKNKLEKEKTLLIEELSPLAILDQDTNRWIPHPEPQTEPEADDNDLADRFEDFDERASTVETLDARLYDITSAIQSLEDGTYGICKVCGNKIEEDRLEANPAAQTCKHCMNQ